MYRSPLMPPRAPPSFLGALPLLLTQVHLRLIAKLSGQQQLTIRRRWQRANTPRKSPGHSALTVCLVSPASKVHVPNAHQVNTRTLHPRNGMPRLRVWTVPADGNECHWCPAGYRPNPTRTGCIGCLEGWFSNDIQNATHTGVYCRRCAPGKEPNARLFADGCNDCFGNEFSPGNGSFCDTCGNGEEPNGEQTGCQL